MSKTVYQILSLIAVMLPLFAAHPPHKTVDEIIATLKKNEKIGRNRPDKPIFQTQPKSFKLLVIQPTPKLKRIDEFVKKNKHEIRKNGYVINKPEKRHLTLMTFHVPLEGYPGDGEVVRLIAQGALDKLASIVKKHIGTLRGTNFSYFQFGTLINGKHVVAFHDFQSQSDRDKFYEGYHNIVQEFLAAYPECWMSVPYQFKPHVTIATRNPQSDVNTDLNLPHQGKNAFENTITLGYRKKKSDRPSPMKVSIPGFKKVEIK